MRSQITQKNNQTKTWYDHQNNTLIKALTRDYPSENDIQKFRNEFDVLQGKQLLGVRKVIDYQIVDQQHQIVLENIPGTSLRDFLVDNPLMLVEKVHLMIKIAKVLENIHQEGIIHKDVNPHTILITPNQEVFLINFDISSRFTLRQPNLGNPEKLEGTLEYISPEQTGRMNRSIDYRTDLYALGATFYELLTRKPVFEENEAMALVHAHLAKVPANPTSIDKTIPTQLAKIILKLLEKNPENRYQSALGLGKDLEKYLALKEKGELYVDFNLGQEDFSGKLQIPEKLYGREQEISVLLEAFQRVKSGGIELTLVTGYSGTGKSALVNETHRPLTSTKGYFIEGKFDQFQRNIPFSAWIQAFNNLIELILTEDEEALEYWRNLILAAVGDNGAVLIEVIPNLEVVIGKQPQVAELGGQEAQNRFNYVMQNFLRAITTEEHPLIIFIDDLQWADLASLNLLKTLMTDQDNQYLLCVGAYRDNEVSAIHPLTATLKSIEEETKNINQIKLENLSAKAVLDLLAETLHSSKDEQLKSLKQLILSKTQGNAFFTHQFLKNLYEEALLTFDFVAKKWTWNSIKIQEANFTDNVVAFMANKVDNLPATTQELLEQASCVGNKFNHLTLNIIAQKVSIKKDLEMAILEGLILPLSNNQYKFAHDRVQQAAYSLIPESKKQVTHLKIGQLLYESLSKEEKEERLFDITNHYNLATEIFDDTDKTIALKLNIEAAKKTKTSASFDSMLQYIHQAKNLLPENSWESASDTTHDIYQLLVEAEFLNTNFENVEKYIAIFLAHAQTKLAKAKILTFAILQKTVEGQYNEAINIGIQALNLLSISTPNQDELGTINDEIIAQLIAQINDVGVQNILNLPITSYEEIELAIKIYILLDPATYISGNVLMYIFVSIKAAELSLKHGLASFTPKSLANFALIAGSMKGDYTLGYQLGKVAFSLSQKMANKGMECQTSLLLGGWLQQWTRPLQEGIKHNLHGIQAGLSSGELQFALYNVFTYNCNIFASGQTLDFIKSEIKNKYWGLSLKYKNELSNNVLLGILWITNTLQGNVIAPIQVQDQSQTEDMYEKYCQDNNIAMALAVYYTYKAQALFILGDYDKAYEKISLALPMAGAIFGYLASFDLNFYTSLTYLKQYEVTRNEELLETVKTNQVQMKIWATNCPENFLHKYQLVEVKQAQIEGKSFNEISSLYKTTIKNAEQNHFIQDAALATELYGQYLLSVEEEMFAKPYLNKSYHLYKQWGANAKIAQMKVKYAKLLDKENQIASETYHSNGVLNTDKTGLDLDTILKANATLSQQVHLRGLIQTMLDLLIKNSGANKVTFLRKETNTWLVEADQENDVNFLTAPIPLERYTNIPQQAINYALRNKEVILRDNISQDTTFRKDAYIQQHQSKSVLILPIKKQAKLIALLYLENSLNTEVFHKKRVELVSAITTQLVISMENTLLYKNLENKVALRTKELQESNEELQVMNEELRQTQEELQTQRDYVAEKNKVLQEFNTKINGSLKVAQAIQEAVLPYRAKLNRLLENYFIINQPKDVVSGDFYWLNEVNGKVILVVADCTGHGIPGAFMTLIGANLLDKIIQIQQITQPNEILNRLHEEVTAVLKQRYTTNNKGMDATVISLEKKNGQTTIQFSGAKNNLFYYTGDLYELRGDRKSIGGIQDERIGFTNQQLTLPTGGMLYLGSDGLEDQNNHTRKKFGRKRLQALLSYVATLPVGDQKTKIEETLKYFMQDTEQRDDILWMGIRV